MNPKGSPVLLSAGGLVVGLLVSLGVLWAFHLLAHPKAFMDLGGLFVYAASLGLSGPGFGLTISGWRATEARDRSSGVLVFFYLSCVLNSIPVLAFFVHLILHLMKGSS